MNNSLSDPVFYTGRKVTERAITSDVLTFLLPLIFWTLIAYTPYISSIIAQLEMEHDETTSISGLWVKAETLTSISTIAGSSGLFQRPFIEKKLE